MLGGQKVPNTNGIKECVNNVRFVFLSALSLCGFVPMSFFARNFGNFPLVRTTKRGSVPLFEVRGWMLEDSVTRSKYTRQKDNCSFLIFQSAKSPAALRAIVAGKNTARGPSTSTPNSARGCGRKGRPISPTLMRGGRSPQKSAPMPGARMPRSKKRRNRYDSCS